MATAVSQLCSCLSLSLPLCLCVCVLMETCVLNPEQSITSPSCNQASYEYLAQLYPPCHIADCTTIKSCYNSSKFFTNFVILHLVIVCSLRLINPISSSLQFCLLFSGPCLPSLHHICPVPCLRSQLSPASPWTPRTCSALLPILLQCTSNLILGSVSGLPPCNTCFHVFFLTY